MSSSDIEQVNQLSFSIDGITTHNFDLAFGDVFKELTGVPLSESSADGAWEDASQIAKYLNLGELNASGITLQSLGIFASGNAGNLTLSLDSGDFEDGATLMLVSPPIAAITSLS